MQKGRQVGSTIVWKSQLKRIRGEHELNWLKYIVNNYLFTHLFQNKIQFSLIL